MTGQSDYNPKPEQAEGFPAGVTVELVDTLCEAPDDELDHLVALWLRAQRRLRVAKMAPIYSDPLGPHWLASSAGGMT